MKNFYKWTLTTTIFAIGWVCVMAYAMLKGIHWYHWLLLMGSWLITLPAIWWWKDYFDRTFDNK